MKIALNLLKQKKFIQYEFKDPKTYSNGDLGRKSNFRDIRQEIKDWIEDSFIKDLNKKNR